MHHLAPYLVSSARPGSPGPNQDHSRTAQDQSRNHQCRGDDAQGQKQDTAQHHKHPTQQSLEQTFFAVAHNGQSNPGERGTQTTC